MAPLMALVLAYSFLCWVGLWGLNGRQFVSPLTSPESERLSCFQVVTIMGRAALDIPPRTLWTRSDFSWADTSGTAESGRRCV